MENKIALYLQDHNKLISFSSATKMIVFEKDDSWIKTQELKTEIKNITDVAKYRTAVKSIINELGNCKVVAGENLDGIAYNEFDKAGYFIFDITNYNNDVFDGIIDDIKSNNESDRIKNEMLKNAQPVETATQGIYYLDLIAVQKQFPELSSKAILQNFFKSTPFVELRLACSHLPPWIENSGFAVKNLTHSDASITAIVTKKQC